MICYGIFITLFCWEFCWDYDGRKLHHQRARRLFVAEKRSGNFRPEKRAESHSVIPALSIKVAPCVGDRWFHIRR